MGWIVIKTDYVELESDVFHNLECFSDGTATSQILFRKTGTLRHKVIKTISVSIKSSKFLGNILLTIKYL